MRTLRNHDFKVIAIYLRKQTTPQGSQAHDRASPHLARDARGAVKNPVKRRGQRHSCRTPFPPSVVMKLVKNGIAQVCTFEHMINCPDFIGTLGSNHRHQSCGNGRAEKPHPITPHRLRTCRKVKVRTSFPPPDTAISAWRKWQNVWA